MASEVPAKLGRGALTVLAATIFVSVMNASMSSLVLPDMKREFGLGEDTLSWVVTAYLIPFATGTVIYGRIADMAGTRFVYLMGLAIFAAASLGVAVSPTFAMVVAMRAAQGFGGTAIPALSMATILRTTTPAERGAAMGATVLAVGVGFAAGPLVGGTLTEWFGWPGPFLFTGVAALVLIPLALRSVPAIPGRAGQRFDYAGAGLMVLAVTGVILALNRLPRDPANVLGLSGAILAVPLWGAFFVRIARAREPFVAPSVLKNARFMSLAFIGFTAQGTHFAVVVLLPLLYTRYHQLDVIEIGLRLLPGALALAAFGMAGGSLVNRLGERVLIIAGSWVLFAAVFTLHVAGVEWSTWQVAGLYAAVASGYGMINAAVIKAATDTLPEDSAGVGVGVFNLLFFLGGAVSVAIVTAIVRARANAAEPWNGLFDGVPIAYSDAFLAVTVLALLGFTVAVLQAPRRVETPLEPPLAFVPLEEATFLSPDDTRWVIMPRAKPNATPTRAVGDEPPPGEPPAPA